MKLKLKIKKSDILKFVLISFKYFNILLIILVLIVAGFLSFFIYQYFYQTVTQAEEVIVLKKEVAPNTINTAKIEAVLKALETKKTAEIINWQKIRNPFRTTATTEPITEAVTQPEIPEEQTPPPTEE